MISIRPNINFLKGTITEILCTPKAKFSTSAIILARNLSNKRVTRIQSDIQLDECEHSSRLTNRNPRNLEQMSLAMKPNGFWLDRAPPLHWNRIEFETKGKYLEATLVYWSGKPLITASTKEPALAPYLKSTSTAEAAVILAQVFARRCLQSGYLYAQPEESEDNALGHKRKIFLESLEKAGLCLSEPPQIVTRTITDN